MKMLMNKRIGHRRYIILWKNGWFDFSRFGEKMYKNQYIMMIEKSEYDEEIEKFIEKIKKGKK